MLWGLRTLWADSLGTRDLVLHLRPWSPLLGALGSVLAAALAVASTLRDLRRLSPRALLAGAPRLEDGHDGAQEEDRARHRDLHRAEGKVRLPGLVAQRQRDLASGFHLRSGRDELVPVLGNRNSEIFIDLVGKPQPLGRMDVDRRAIDPAVHRAAFQKRRRIDRFLPVVGLVFVYSFLKNKKILLSVPGLFEGQMKEGRLFYPYINATPFLDAAGDVIVSWFLLWAAVVASEKLNPLFQKNNIEGIEQQRSFIQKNTDVKQKNNL